MNVSSEAKECRACLEQAGSCKSIFSLHEDFGLPSNSFADIIMSSSPSINISLNDGLPDVICSHCSAKVLEFYKFKIKIEENELILRSRAFSLTVGNEESNFIQDSDIRIKQETKNNDFVNKSCRIDESEHAGSLEVMEEDNLSRECNNSEESLIKKSGTIYEHDLKKFVNWKLKNSINIVNESVMMTYFQELAKEYTPNSLKTKYSKLKTSLIVNDNIDISCYKRLVSFLKKGTKGYIPKKTKVFTGDQVLRFMKDAPNETYLLHKVVLVMGLFGGLRREEMVNLTIDNIHDKGSAILVKLSKTNTSKAKCFTIMEEKEIGALKLIRQYAKLRPRKLEDRRFFLIYRNKQCTSRPVGKNAIGSVPTGIARFLKLDNANEYTGHCLNRSSSAFMVEAGVTFQSMEMFGKWRTTAVAEGSLEERAASRNITKSMTDESEGDSSLSSCRDHQENPIEFCNIDIKEEPLNTELSFVEESYKIDNIESKPDIEFNEELYKRCYEAEDGGMDEDEEDNLASADESEEFTPKKSKVFYENELKLLNKWKLKNAVEVVNETVLMAYFEELSKQFTPSTLRTKYSKLKSTLIINDNIDISCYNHLITFLNKRRNAYIPKKSKVLTGDQVLSFMKNAPNESYLLHKVVMVMGLFGGLKRDEMVNLSIDDIQEKGSDLLVKVPKSKTAIAKYFTIIDEEEIGALKLVREYAKLRPTKIKERRFFLIYKNNQCTSRPVGKNAIGSVPTAIAKFLKLDNAHEYTGHCLHISSSAFRGEAGAMLKRSTTGADAYVEESMDCKTLMSTNEENKGEFSLNTCLGQENLIEFHKSVMNQEALNNDPLTFEEGSNE